MNDYSKMILLFIIYSVIGYIYEIVYVSICEKKFTDRGFLIGPVIPIYGVGGLLIAYFLTPFKNNIFILIPLIVLTCLVVEYFTGYIFDKIFKTKLWDYSDKKYNLNGYICLEATCYFLGLALSSIYLVNPFILNLLTKIPSNITNILSISLLVLFILDFIASITLFIKFTKTTENKGDKDSTNDFKKYVKNTIKSILCK